MNNPNLDCSKSTMAALLPHGQQH